MRRIVRASSVAIGLLAWVAAACSTDVRLGDLPSDSGVIDASAADATNADALSPPPDAGAPEAGPDAGVADRGSFDGGDARYDLRYGPVIDVFCADGLAGREDRFRTLTATTEGLVSDEVRFTRTGSFSYFMDGPAITSSFGLHSLSFTPDNGPDAQPGIYISEAIYFGGPGPDDTTRSTGGMWLDLSAPTSSTSTIAGAVGIAFEDAAQSGFCGVVFLLSLAPR